HHRHHRLDDGEAGLGGQGSSLTAVRHVLDIGTRARVGEPSNGQINEGGGGPNRGAAETAAPAARGVERLHPVASVSPPRVRPSLAGSSWAYHRALYINLRWPSGIRLVPELPAQPGSRRARYGGC